MTLCCVKNCKNSTYRGGLRLFRIPRGERRQVWLNILGLSNISESTRICEIHFSMQQFEAGRMDGRSLLKPNAYPDLLVKDNETVTIMVQNIESDCAKKRKVDGQIVNLPNIPEPIILLDEPEDEDDKFSESGDADPLDDELLNTEVDSKELDVEAMGNELLYKRLQSKDVLIDTLRKQLKSVLRKCRTYEEKLKQKEPSRLEAIFNEDQLEFIGSEKRRGSSWSDDTIEKGFKLYLACGAKGYQEILNQKLPYPSIRTLQYRRNLQLQSPFQ